MLDKILAFFRPNLTKVIGKFEKAIADLEAIGVHEQKRTEQANAKIARAEAVKAESAITAERAENVRRNLRTLIGG